MNQSVPEALQYLGYDESQRPGRSSSISTKNETIEGAPHLTEEDLTIFDCAFKPRSGSARSTTWATCG